MSNILLPLLALSTRVGWDAEGLPTAAKLNSDDGATTAVYSPTNNDYMRFTIDTTTLPAGSLTITSLVVGFKTLKLDPVVANVRPTLTIGGTTYEGDSFSPTASGSYYLGTYEWTVNPATGVAFTAAELATMLVGINNKDGNGKRVSYLYVYLTYTTGGGTSGRVKVKLSGTFTAKPVKVKIAGTFATKPMKKKISGTFSSTT